MNKVGKAFYKISKTFDLEVKSIKRFLIFEFISTILANYLRRSGSSIDISENVLKRSVFEGSVDSIKDNIKEFLSILLNTDVNRLAEAIFKGVAEANGVIILPITHNQETKHFLYLMKQVVVYLYVFLFNHVWWFMIFNSKQTIPKCFTHKELLKHRINVTNTP